MTQLQASAIKNTVLSIQNIGFLLLHLWLRPYNNVADNALETTSLTLLSLVTVLLTAEPQPGASLSTVLTTFLAVIVLPTALIFALLVLRSRLREFKQRRAVAAEDGIENDSSINAEQLQRDRGHLGSIDPQPLLLDPL